MTDYIGTIDRLTHRILDLEAELAAVRRALGGYDDSNLASLAETLVAQRRLLANAYLSNWREVPGADPHETALRLSRAILDDEPAPQPALVEWTSVKDKLPKEEQVVLGWVADFGQPLVVYQQETTWYLCGPPYGAIEKLFGDVVSYWQPLPPPPGSSHHGDVANEPVPGELQYVDSVPVDYARADRIAARGTAPQPAPDERMWRTLVRVDGTDERGLLFVTVPGFDPNISISIPFADIPQRILDRIDDAPMRLYARVNLDTEDANRLRFEGWELPAPDEGDERHAVGEALIEWAADEDNVMAKDEYGAYCVFLDCRALQEPDGIVVRPHVNSCLHLRARALRGDE